MAIAKRAEAFGMSIAYTSRNAQAGSALPLLRRAPRRSPREVDFLVVITPGGAGTRKLIDAKVLTALGKKGYLDQRRARLGRRRAGAGRGAAERHDRRRRPRRVRERAERAGELLAPRQRRPHAARRQRDLADAPGDGRPRVRQPRGAFRRQAAALAGAMSAPPRFDLVGRDSRSSPAPARASAWRWRAAWPRPARASSSTAATLAKLDAAAAQLRADGLRGRDRAPSTSPTRPPCAAASPRVQASFGPVDILVNNAGIQHRAPIDEFSDADWRRLMATNLDAPFYMARAVIPAMKARRAGKIINIASLMSSLARPTTVPYQTSKGGIAMLTRGLAVELAPHDIQVNAIAPGFFRTEMNAALTGNAGVQRLGREAHAGRPLGRAARARRRGGLPRLAGRALRDRPDPLRRRRLHRRHVRTGADRRQSWPSVSASSWKRPSLWTSQISVNLTRRRGASAPAAGRRA